METPPRKSTANRAAGQGSTWCSTSGGMPWVSPAARTDEGDRVGARHEAERAALDADPAPRSRRRSDGHARAQPASSFRPTSAMCARVSGRPAASHRSHDGQSRVVPMRRSRCSSSSTHGAIRKRRAMSYVLAMKAVQKRNPVAGVVGGEADDRPVHAYERTNERRYVDDHGSVVTTSGSQPRPRAGASDRSGGAGGLPVGRSRRQERCRRGRRRGDAHRPVDGHDGRGRRHRRGREGQRPDAVQRRAGRRRQPAAGRRGRRSRSTGRR